METCSTANPGYLLKDGAFITCIDNCQECLDSETCEVCNYGYYLGDEKKSCNKAEGGC